MILRSFKCWPFQHSTYSRCIILQQTVVTTCDYKDVKRVVLLWLWRQKTLTTKQRVIHLCYVVIVRNIYNARTFIFSCSKKHLAQDVAQIYILRLRLRLLLTVSSDERAIWSIIITCDAWNIVTIDTFAENDSSYDETALVIYALYLHPICFTLLQNVTDPPQQSGRKSAVMSARYWEFWWTHPTKTPSLNKLICE